MARSRKKVPVFKHTHAGSMKWWKRTAHKSMRQQFRLRIMQGAEWDEIVYPELREISNIYNSPQDGGHRITKKPDDLECQREQAYEIMMGYIHRLNSIEYYMGNDGHYLDKDKCECITNKGRANYWKVFRK